MTMTGTFTAKCACRACDMYKEYNISPGCFNLSEQKGIFDKFLKKEGWCILVYGSPVDADESITNLPEFLFGKWYICSDCIKTLRGLIE